MTPSLYVGAFMAVVCVALGIWSHKREIAKQQRCQQLAKFQFELQCYRQRPGGSYSGIVSHPAYSDEFGFKEIPCAVMTSHALPRWAVLYVQVRTQGESGWSDITIISNVPGTNGQVHEFVLTQTNLSRRIQAVCVWIAHPKDCTVRGSSTSWVRGVDANLISLLKERAIRLPR